VEGSVYFLHIAYDLAVIACYSRIDTFRLLHNEHSRCTLVIYTVYQQISQINDTWSLPHIDVLGSPGSKFSVA
jgi:hypothetical protein